MPHVSLIYPQSIEIEIILIAKSITEKGNVLFRKPSLPPKKFVRAHNAKRRVLSMMHGNGPENIKERSRMWKHATRKIQVILRKTTIQQFFCSCDLVEGQRRSAHHCIAGADK